jgi:alpha-glucosidase
VRGAPRQLTSGSFSPGAPRRAWVYLLCALAAATLLLAAAGSARAVPISGPFGPYYLTQDKLAPGLWYFQISEAPSDPAASLKRSPLLADPDKLVGRIPFTPFSATQVEGRPTLKITAEGDDAQTVFNISPHAPEGRLTGLMFHGESFTHIFGLGVNFQLTAANLNHMGQVFMPGGPYGNRLQITEQGRTSGLQAPICYALGPDKFAGALFVNETRPLMWDFSARPWTVSLAGPLHPDGSLGFFVITGGDLPALRRAYMRLVGLPPVPPLSIFAPWVIDDGQVSPEGVMDRLRTIKSQLGDPVSLGVLSRLPTDKLPFTAAKALGIDLLARENPYVPQSSPHFADLAKRGFLVRSGGPTGPPLLLDFEGQKQGLVDYTDPAAATYWHSLTRAPIVQAGASVFYLHGGEPEAYSSLAWYRGVSDPDTHSHYSWSNRFILKWMEGFLLSMSAQRFPGAQYFRDFLLSRAGSGSMGRFGAGLYALDPNIFFPQVEGQARAHVSLSGVDYYTTDVAPLLAEWPLSTLRLAYEAWGARNVFLNLPLLLPDAFLGEPWLPQALKVKAVLEPYYYSLAHLASLKGDPIVSPLFYYFQEDPLARDRPFESMLGPFILVGGGLTQGIELVPVYLPQGRWLDYFTEEVIVMEKGAPRNLPAKLEGSHLPPILLREGAIVPTRDGLLGQDIVNIRLFPGPRASSFEWREDNGLNDRYLAGEKTMTLLELSAQAENAPVTLTIRAREGALPGAPASRAFLLSFAGLSTIKVARLDGELQDRVSLLADLAEAEAAWYSLGEGSLYFKTPSLDLSRDHVIVIE